MKVLCVVLCLSVIYGVAVADHWGYPNPAPNGAVLGNENWGGACDEGLRQSPIDLSYAASVRGYFPEFDFSEYDDIVPNANVTNNGHSVQVVVGAPENIVLKGGGLEGEYVFDQMHFHWGSEHTIDGRRYALELHMVHHDRRYSLQEALTKKNGIAVLGVLFHVSLVENKKLQIILDSVDDIAEVVGAEAPIRDLLRITDLMPVRRDSYFRYEGSLTTPSCMESVVWTIFTQTIPVSLHQLERLKLVKAADGKDLLNNYRQVQPLNARALVYASNEKADGFLLSQYMSGASALSIRIEVMAVFLLISLWILRR